MGHKVAERKRLERFSSVLETEARPIYQRSILKYETRLFSFSREVFSCCLCLKVVPGVGLEPTLMRGRNRRDYPIADPGEKF